MPSSSRNKSKVPPVVPPSVRRTPPQQQQRPPTPAKSSRARYWIASVLVGIILGLGLATIAFFNNRKVVDLGVITRTPGGPSAIPDKELFAAYAGSGACRECHAAAYEAWAKSHHALAERDPDLSGVDRGAFDPPRTFSHGTQKSQVRTRDGRLEVVTTSPEGDAKPYAVTRVIGVEPLRQFLVPASGGRLQTLEASYDPAKNEWFNVYGNEDRMHGEWGHWTGRGMNWNSQCAACHNTRVRKNYDERTDSYQTAMAQLTVSCESCHGPMKQHVELKKKGGGPTAGGTPATYRFTKDQTLDTCGSCHARRAELTGDFAPGDSFSDHYSLTVPDLTDLFYPDGQIREEDYEFTSFLGTKMHTAGVRCGDCHEPHTSKPLFAGNALCMRCHNGSFKGSPLIVPEAHSFHKAESTGNQCVNCHMPQTTYMQRHARHDHGFTVPDPLLTKEIGVPNACNRCHKDKDANWAIAAVETRYGAKMNRPSRERARWIAKARKGDDGAREPIQRMLKEEKQPLWQATAAAILGEWALVSRDAAEALLGALQNPDPLVRENAVRALERAASRQRSPIVREAMDRATHDRSRAVRIRAAWAMRDAIKPETQPGRELRESLRINADQPTGAMQQGMYQFARGENDSAIAYFTRASEWDPRSPQPHEALAMVFSVQGKTPQAIDQLNRAIRLDPRDAEYPYKLALAYNEVGRVEKTIELLGEALKLNPRHPRAGYNLGLAHNQAGRRDEAIAALRKAESVNPNDPEIPYARATIHFKLGQRDEARAAAQQALRIEPNYAAALELLRSVDR